MGEMAGPASDLIVWYVVNSAVTAVVKASCLARVGALLASSSHPSFKRHMASLRAKGSRLRSCWRHWMTLKWVEMLFYPALISLLVPFLSQSQSFVICNNEKIRCVTCSSVSLFLYHCIIPTGQV